jgi:hypothetical protein
VCIVSKFPGLWGRSAGQPNSSALLGTRDTCPSLHLCSEGYLRPLRGGWVLPCMRHARSLTTPQCWTAGTCHGLARSAACAVLPESVVGCVLHSMKVDSGTSKDSGAGQRPRRHAPQWAGPLLEPLLTAVRIPKAQL